jgi:hypothetical protein
MPASASLALAAAGLMLALPVSASAAFSSLGIWSTTFDSPDAIALVPGPSGAAQDVWVSEDTGDTPGDDVQELTPTGAHQLTIDQTFACQGTTESFDFPNGLAIYPATGNLFIDDSGDSRIIEFTSGGTFVGQLGGGEFSTTCGTPATDSTGSDPGYFDEPTGLSVGDGRLFVAQPGPDNGSGGNPYTDEIPLPLTTTSSLRVAELPDGAYGQAVYDAVTGDVYAADSAPNSIDVYTPDGTHITTWPDVWDINGTPTEYAALNPQWLAIDPGAGVLYAVDTGNDAIYTFDIDTGTYLQELTGLDSPEGVAVDPVSHVLYVVEDGSTNTVARYSYTPAPTCTPATATSGGGQVSLPVSCTDQAGAPITYALTSQPAHGSASVNSSTGQVTYTPSAGYAGPDSFTYDGLSIDGTSQPATVSIAVQPPSCAAESLASGYEQPLQVTLSCSGNSTSAASYRIITPPADGTLSTPSADGTLTYTPKDAFAGQDSFTFEGVSATGLASAPVSVTLEVGEALPPPVAGQSANVFLASGKVTVTLPGRRTPIPLTAGMQVPLGSIINATDGRVGVFVASASGIEGADFYKGEFRLTQSASDHARRASADRYALLTLLGRKIPKARCATYAKSFSGTFKLGHVARLHGAKRNKSAFAEGRKPSRQLWGSGHGNFTTVGNGSSSSVRGTIWAIFDYPDGTLTRVYTDSVSVYDFHRHKTVVVRAGHFYFAALGTLPACR